MYPISSNMFNHQAFSLKALHYETLQPVRIDVEEGLIAGITNLIQEASASGLAIAAPGLIDNQVNGYAGVDFSGENLSTEEVARATRALWDSGVTTYLPTLITNTAENLIRNFGILADSCAHNEVRLSVPGFHLEGPWLSKLEGFRGCHREDQLSYPDISQLISFQNAAKGGIIQVTLAPELPGAIEMINYCRMNGILSAIGHSNASGDEIGRACQNGATLSTHLGNGCANLIHRHQNPIWPQLAEEQLIPTLIADGHHLSPEELKVFLQVKGKERIILTSDITYLAGMPAGKYQFAGAEVILTEDGRLRSADQDCLAGASLPLLKGVENMMRFTGCSLGSAINMASGNVANVFGWNDRGALDPGRRADLLLLNFDGDHLSLKTTFLAGKVVYECNS
jgi:N-acetylglucosamine-6-phosphate deacetylase